MASAALYLGTTPADLQSVHHDVRQLLEATGYVVLERKPTSSDSAPDEETHIRTVLGQCSGMILLVGVSHGPDASGAMVTAPSSFTQLEHRLAQELGVPCYTYLLDEEFPYEDGIIEPPTKQAAQCRFRVKLKAQPRGWEEVDTPERLMTRLRLVTFRLEDLRLSSAEPTTVTTAATSTPAVSTLAQVSAPPPLTSPPPPPGAGFTESRTAPSPNLAVPPPVPAGFRQHPANEHKPATEAERIAPSRVEPTLPPDARPQPSPLQSPPQKARFGLAAALVLAGVGIAALIGAVVIALNNHDAKTEDTAAAASTESSAPISPATAAATEATAFKPSDQAVAAAPVPVVPASPQTDEPDPAKRPAPPTRTDGHALTDHDIITKLSWEFSRGMAPYDAWAYIQDRSLLAVAAQEKVDPEKLSKYESAISYLRTANPNESPLWKAYSARLSAYEPEAIKYAMEAIEKKDARDAPEDFTPYFAWLIVGDAHLAMQEYQQAAKAYRNAMSLFGRHHAPLMWCSAADRLGFTLRHTGEWAEAEKVLRESLEEQERSSGSEDPKQTNARSDLAWVLNAINKPDEAQRLMQQALDTDAKALGPDNPRTVERARELAKMLEITTHRPEIESLYRRALASEEKVWGKDHAVSVPTLLQLALVLRGNDTAAEAQALCRKAIAICTREYGADAICVAEGYERLARVFYIQGNKSKSTEVLAQASEALSSYRPVKSLGVAGVDKDIALLSAQAAGGMPDPMRAAEVKALVDVYLETVGENHPATAEVLLVVARYHPREAVRIYQRIVRIHTTVYGPNHPRVLKSLMELLSLMGSGSYSKSEKEPYIQAALANAQHRSPADPADAGITLGKLSEALKECSHEGSVVPLLQKASAILERRHGAYREVTLGCLVALRTALLSEGRESEARALEIRLQEAAKLIGPDKTATVHSSSVKPDSNLSTERTPSPASPQPSGNSPMGDAAAPSKMEDYMYDIVMGASYGPLPDEPKLPKIALQDATAEVARKNGLDPKTFTLQVQNAARELERSSDTEDISGVFAKVILQNFEGALESLKALKARRGVKAEEIARYHVFHGHILTLMGKHPEAAGLFRDASRMVQKNENPAVWAVIQFMIGYCQAARNDWDTAALTFEGILELAEKDEGEMAALVRRHLALAKMKGNGNLKDVETLLRRALAGHRKLPHLVEDVIHDLTLLAEALRILGRDEEALPYAAEAVQLQRNEFAPDHPTLARCLLIQGDVLTNLERDREAVTALKEAAELREHHFGARHPTMMVALLYLGVTERNAGLFDDSVTHLTRAVQIEEGSGNPPNTATIILHNHLGVSLHEAGRLDEAEKRLRKTVSMAESIPQANLALVLKDLASVLIDQKDVEEAEVVMRRSVELTRKKLPKNHPTLSDRLYLLSRVLAGAQKYEECAKVLREAYAIMVAAHGVDSVSVALCGQDFGLVLGATGQIPEAEKVLRQSIATLAKEAGTSKVLKEKLVESVKLYEKILKMPEYRLPAEAIQSRIEKILDGQQVPELRAKRVP